MEFENWHSYNLIRMIRKVDSDNTRNELQSQMSIEPDRVSLSLEGFIRNCMEKLEREGTILGLSGGIDSAVVALLCKRAVGSHRTLAIIMPDKDSSEEHKRDAFTLAKESGIETKLIDITAHLDQLGAYELLVLNRLPLSRRMKGDVIRRICDLYERRTGQTPFSATILGLKGKPLASYLRKGSAHYRIKHRLRMVLLYLYGELENRLVVGAANKTEYEIGLFVKHGCDDAADIMPLLGLYKTQVRELARYLNIPSRIIEKSPSPDLVPGMNDQKAIGISYETLDLILSAFKSGLNNEEISRVLGIEETKVTYARGLVQKSEHMRNVYLPDDCQVRSGS